MKNHEIQRKICDEMASVYQVKNERYGDSYAKLRNELGKDSILYRLGDKYNRLVTLLRNPFLSEEDESIDDTLLDLAIYCTMELTERKLDNERNDIQRVQQNSEPNNERAGGIPDGERCARPLR